MSENWGNIDELIVRHLTESLNADEEQRLEDWLNHSMENKEYYRQMQMVWDTSENIMAFDDVDVMEDYNHFASKVGFAAEKRIGFSRFVSFKNIAAVLLPLLSVGMALTLYQTTPGFGKWVAFSSNNEVEQIVLPDNSTVDLNTKSRLVYEKNLDGKQRQLKLEGEGFFQVTKNPDQPFVVKVGETQVTVLGTAFYLEEKGLSGETNLIVTEGRVLFSSGDEKIVVSKGESAKYLNGKITKTESLPHNNMAWRTGMIEFDQTSLDQVLETLLDHFSDQILQVENQSKNTDRVITTKFDSPSLEEVLVELRIHFDKNFTMDGKKLIISD